MKPAPFDYLRADDEEEALEALAEAGDDARLLAGGQTLMPMLNMRLVEPAVLIDISRLPGRAEISDDGAVIEVGAAATQADLEAWPPLARRSPLLAAALPLLGHVQTRSRGTVCGSIAFADPSAELPLCLAVLGGEAVLRSRAGTRTLPAAEFQTGMLSTACRWDEMVTAVCFPTAEPGAGYAFTEFARRHGDFAIVAVAAIARGERRARRCRRRRRAAGRPGLATPGRQRARRRAQRTGLVAGCRRRCPSQRPLPARAGTRPWQANDPRSRGRAAVKRIEAESRHRVGLTLNGREAGGWAEPRMLLSDFLRHELGATGTHVGCEHGVCGACTVRLDGAPVRACLTLAVQAEGRHVDTVEGLSPEGELNDLQKAFRRHHALQCGFCTPGILMSLDAYLETKPEPDEGAIRALLSGHLCRCTGYSGIVAAALEAAEARRSEDD